jgi:hypothetical protein
MRVVFIINLLLSDCALLSENLRKEKDDETGCICDDRCCRHCDDHPFASAGLVLFGPWDNRSLGVGPFRLFTQCESDRVARVRSTHSAIRGVLHHVLPVRPRVPLAAV